MNNVAKIHVRVLDEWVQTVMEVQAENLGNGRHRILPTNDYAPETEEWEFVPGDIVRCEKIEKGWAEPLFLAVERVG